MVIYDDIPAEATRVDFKVKVERSKPTSSSMPKPVPSQTEHRHRTLPPIVFSVH